jgi:hypothetical protein
MPDMHFVFIPTVYRTVRSVYLFFVCILPLLGCLQAADAVAEDKNDYLTALVRSAREKRLDEDRTWKILLHYEKAGSGVESLVDDPKFFLAPGGKKAPRAELEATIAGFFEKENNEVEHPQCRFIARYTWLKEQLSIDEARLPRVECAKWKEALASVNPKSAVLVFPAAHGNGPSSMFGHTLVRIDSDKRNELLSHAVSYAAYTEQSGGFAYAFRGIFGYFKGYFSILPYYEKVTEYNNIDHRDIWEYELNFSREEVLRMVMHMWELKDIYSDYYFFDENCSYDLLYLLESARPSLKLTDEFRGKLKFWVIPTDTVRVVKESGIVGKINYRPSQATRILFLASRTKSAHQDTALAIVKQKIPPQTVLTMELTPEDKKQILDLAAELIQYRFSRKEIEKEDYQKQFLAALNARSTLGVSTADSVPVPSTSPDQGHLPGKFSAGLGYRTDSYFTEIIWRPAYHDLMDPDGGYVEGAQINFFDLRGRYYFNEEKARLQSFRVIDILSLATRDKFFQPVSWKVNTGLEQELLADGKEHLIGRLNVGGGVAYPSRFIGTSYLMLDADLIAGGALRDNFSFGIGPSAGILKKLTPAWKLNLFVQAMFYDLGDEHDKYKASLAQSYTLNANNAVDLTLSRVKTFHQYQSEARVTWNHYF